MTPRQSRFDQELAQVAETYRDRLAWDQSRASAGKVRAQCKRLQDAGLAFIAAWSELSEQARATLGVVLRDREHLEPNTYQRDGINAVGEIIGAAAMTAQMTPTRWKDTAQRLMTGSVREVCKRHNVPFTSTVDAYGQTSKAVAAVRRVVKLVGGFVTADSAAGWIKQQLKETKNRKLS